MLNTADRVNRSATDISVLPRPWRSPRSLTVLRPGVDYGRRTRSKGRRALNVAIAFLGILLTAPLMLLIAFLIKLTSPGPVLYMQQRVGVDRRSGNGGNWRRRIDYGGRLFTIYKFRTMVARSEGSEDQVWAAPGDARITPIGATLRKYRLDELPQLFNVLKGDMNVVGPRPEQPRIFMELREHVPRYPERQRLLPGITGLAQVSHKYDENVDDVKRKLEFDLLYLQRESTLEDLRIMARTIPVMLFRRGGW